MVWGQAQVLRRPVETVSSFSLVRIAQPRAPGQQGRHQVCPILVVAGKMSLCRDADAGSCCAGWVREVVPTSCRPSGSQTYRLRSRRSGNPQTWPRK